jgi:SAM-dependent methyltransferase
VNLIYISLRMIRHFLPERLVRFMLLRSMIIKPGLETLDPDGAVLRYLDVLLSHQMSLKGRRVLVFGYGGRFDIGVGLLEAGASHVALCERYSRPDDRHNAALQLKHGEYIRPGQRGPLPNDHFMQLIEADLRKLPVPKPSLRYDLVISNSVFEHVDDASGITKALADWTKPDGLQVHFVDLRDHYFRYPFEMLKFSERTWRRYLNPSSNHNRLRLWDYRSIFQAHFSQVVIEALARDEQAFARAQRYLRPEFVSGNVVDDAVTLIRITARRPIQRG